MPFRSHQSLRIQTEGGSVALVGPNGAGKTNVLEAVSLLTPGRGLRRAALSDMAPLGNGSFTLVALLEEDGIETRIVTATKIMPESGPRRVVRIDGTEVASSEALLDHLRVLWITPDLERQFMEAKVARRSFLDRFVMAFDPAHVRRSVDLERTLRARSVLLDQRASSSRLDALDKVLAGLFASVHRARARCVDILQDEIDGRVENPFPKADLKLLSGWDEDVGPDVAEFALETLRRRRAAHLASGRTTEGPHRSDLSTFHRAKQMEASRCSTGEQKALVLGLVLAQASALWKRTGTAPLLLLDEICSHLDDVRRRSLFASVAEMGCQVFYTGTDAASFEGVDGLKLLHLGS